MAETVHKGQPSGIQVAVDELVRPAETDKFQLNETKCKELQIGFSRSADSFEAVTINNKPIEVVTIVNLLGLTISNNLKWNAHIENASRLYQLRKLKRAKGDPAQLVCFYTTCIRPVLEYVCQVFHNGLPKYLSEELEKIQRRALRIIFQVLATLKECNIAPLYQRRQLLTERLQQQGKWTSPGGNSKQFKSDNNNLVINWYNKKQLTLSFQGRDGPLLKDKLAELVRKKPGEKSDSLDLDPFSSIQRLTSPLTVFEANNNNQQPSAAEVKPKNSSQERSKPELAELVAEIEGIKLDLLIL